MSPQVQNLCATSNTLEFPAQLCAVKLHCGYCKHLPIMSQFSVETETACSVHSCKTRILVWIQLVSFHCCLHLCCYYDRSYKGMSTLPPSHTKYSICLSCTHFHLLLCSYLSPIRHLTFLAGLSSWHRDVWTATQPPVLMTGPQHMIWAYTPNLTGVWRDGTLPHSQLCFSV